MKNESNDTESRTLRLAAAALGTALVVIAWYALDRSRAAVFVPAPDPATVLASNRIEYFWRVLVCAYASPVVFVGLYAWARGREERAWRIAQAALVPVVVVAAALALVAP